MAEKIGAVVTSKLASIKANGLALSFGVLFDAFIVRMTLIPSVMKLMGNAAWYLPKWLDKIIPNVDIEGHQLTKEIQPEIDHEQKKQISV